MKNEVAVFMLKEIDGKLAQRKRALPPFLTHQIEQVRFKAARGYDLNPQDSKFLEKQYTRFTDPARLKWGSAVTPR